MFASGTSTRSKRLILLAATVIVGVALWAAAPLVFPKQLRKTELWVAFFPREQAKPSDANYERTQRYETLHRKTLENLVKDFNRSHPKYHLNWVEEKPPDDGKDRSEYRKERYQALKSMRNLVAVFDNSWGEDILQLSDTIVDFPAPIFFLNADKGLRKFGPGRIFLGAADDAPKEIAVLVKELKTRNHVADNDIIFVSEELYPLGEQFKEPLNSVDPTGMIFTRQIILEEKSPSSRIALDQARMKILQAYLHSGTTFETMQGRPKILVLSAHAPWGEAILSFVNTALSNVTVIGYQSVISQRPDISVSENGNRLITLSNSKHRLPQELSQRHNLLKRQNPEAFAREDAPFYIYRCVAAMDILGVLLDQRDRSRMATPNAAQRDSGGPSRSVSKTRPIPDQIAQEAQRQLLKDLDRLPGTRVAGEHDFYRLGKDGILMGMNNYINQGVDGSSPFGLQLRWSEKTPSSIVAIPNVHVGFNKIRISEIDVLSGTFRADVEYWLRSWRAKSNTPQLAETQKSPAQDMVSWPFNAAAMMTGAFAGNTEYWLRDQQDPPGPAPKSQAEEAAPSAQQKAAEHEFLLPLNASVESRDDQQIEIATAELDENLFRIYSLSTRINSPINGEYYPFDRYRLRLELQAWNRDDNLRLSQADLSPESVPMAEGWEVKNAFVTVNSRDSNPVRIPKSALTSIERSTQYDVITVTFEVGRSFISTVIPVIAPIVFLLVASFSLFFIHLGKAPSPSAAVPDDQRAFETEKLRIELSLGCMLAVVTYLISYASLTPRLYRLLYSDYLMAAALFFTVANFAYVVINREDKASGWFAMSNYRWWMPGLALACVAGWIVIGLWQQSVPLPE